MAAAVISDISPNAGAPGVEATIAGTGIVAGAAVSFRGNLLTLAGENVQFVDSTSIKATVPFFGGPAQTLQASVINPSEAASNELPFALSELPATTPVRRLCSLAAVKAFLGLALTDTAEDTQIQAAIDIASKQIESHAGRRFEQFAVADELHDGDGSNMLRTWHSPILTVTALEIDSTAVDVVADVRVYREFVKLTFSEIYEPRLRAFGRVFPIGTQNVKLSYTAGYAAVPKDVSDAAVLQAIYLRNIGNKLGVASETNSLTNVTTAYEHAGLCPQARVVASRYRRTKVRAV